MMSLERKVALVTGASRGIGAEIARQLCAAGASVFLAADESEETIEPVRRACEGTNSTGQAAVGSFDLLEQEGPERMVAAAVHAFGRVDILVNNAGIRVRRPFGSFTSEEFDRVVGVNLKAAFLASQAVVDVMKFNGAGRIINIASHLTAPGGSSTSPVRWAASPNKICRSMASPRQR
jgi:NAD(P)-dependent dehydrogenase (short-subunit alcohol dehydrogenase family)